MKLFRKLFEDLIMIEIVLFHRNCPDGLASMAFYHLFVPVYGKNDGKRFFCGADPNERLLLETIDNVRKEYTDPELRITFLDLAFTKKLLDKVKENFKYYTIIDHHPSTRELEDPSHIVFDANECGATLTWKQFSSLELPLYLKYVRDRDLFTNNLPFSKEVFEGLRKITMSVYDNTSSPIPVDSNGINDRFIAETVYWLKGEKKTGYMNLSKMYDLYTTDSWFSDVCNRGTTLLENKEEILKGMANNAEFKTIKVNGESHEIKVINTNVMISDIGEYIYKHNSNIDYVMIWRFDHKLNKCWISLRSAENQMNVRKVCEYFGGGGHDHASGFECSIEKLIEILSMK